MKFSPKCRTKKLGMIYNTIFGSFAHFSIGKGPIFGPKPGLGKIPGNIMSDWIILEISNILLEIV